jgi:hypothetical protein
MPSDNSLNSLLQSSAENSTTEESSAQDSPSPLAQPSPENGAKKQSASERRIEANRRNASHSTGPKSARGKEISARNSLKHGLLAKTALVMKGRVTENKSEFTKLLSGLHESFKPVGTAEGLLVQEIAISYWMERRAQIYENFVIREQLSRFSSEDECEGCEEHVSQAAIHLHYGKIDALQRYSNYHQKRRSRALAELERLQKQRSGEKSNGS